MLGTVPNKENLYTRTCAAALFMYEHHWLLQLALRIQYIVLVYRIIVQNILQNSNKPAF